MMSQCHDALPMVHRKVLTLERIGDRPWLLIFAGGNVL